MSNFISYNNSDTLDTVNFETVADSGMALINSALNLPSQKQNSFDIETDTTFQTEFEDQSQTSSPDSSVYVEEQNSNQEVLPMHSRSIQSNDWLTIVLFLAFILLVSVRAGFQKYISSLFQSIVNYSTSYRLFNEKNYSFLHGAFRLEVLYYIIFSVFLYQVQVVQFSENITSGLLFFAKTAGFVVLYFLIKKFLYWFAGLVFNSFSETSEFIFNLDNFNRAASIALFPVVALIAYYPFGNPEIIIVIGIITAGFFYLMLLRRGAIILLKKQFSIFYLFLYLCTLEFLPLLLIYKIVV